MFFNRKHLAELGYGILGLHTLSLNTCHHYVKYFDETNSLVLFSTIKHNTVGVFKLMPTDYADFKLGKFALSTTKDSGITPSGAKIRRGNYIEVFGGGEIKNRKALKAYITQAEELAIN